MFPFTHAELLARLRLDPETGRFTRLITTGARSKAGTIATPLNKRCGHGYMRICIDWEQYNYAKVVWFYVHGAWPEREIDHINGDPRDNRPANLRLATRDQNMQARKEYRTNRTGYRGVTRTQGGSFQAHLSINGRKQLIGCYGTAEKAYAAWCAEALRVRGEFACLN